MYINIYIYIYIYIYLYWAARCLGRRGAALNSKPGIPNLRYPRNPSDLKSQKNNKLGTRNLKPRSPGTSNAETQTHQNPKTPKPESRNPKP